MYTDKIKILIYQETIKKYVESLAKQISNDFQNENLTLMCIAKGSIIFVSDLLRNINIPCKLDIIGASSYIGTESSKNVKISFYGRNNDYKNENILIVDDILDTGTTLKEVVKYLEKTLNPKNIKTCVLLDKPSRRIAKINANYVGVEIPNVFVVGYGLDYNEYYRNIPYVGILEI